MAFLGKGEIENAKNELAILEEYAYDENLKELTIWEINSVYTLLQIAERILKAEILASEMEFEESIVLLEEAVEIEDALNYNEPPDWFFSVRHHLGAVQIEAGFFDNAISTYNIDLDNLPKNGWALHGLQLAYSRLGNELLAHQIGEKLDVIWATADIELSTSRIK
jgi:tetratricopeptide (TPR) repeat protein